MSKNRTLTYLGGTSIRRGLDGVQTAARPWGNPYTYVDRLSFKTQSGMALAKVYKMLQRLDDNVDVFLDSSVWDVHLDKKIWNELLNRGCSAWIHRCTSGDWRVVRARCPALQENGTY